MIPSIRVPQILEGPRGSGVGDSAKNFRLLTDLVKLAPRKDEFVFLSASTDLRLLLRGAKTQKDRDGRIIGEFDPLEVKFESGLLRTMDDIAGEMLMKHPKRGRLFFAHEDVVNMKDTADTKQMEAFLSVASPEVIERLKRKITDKSFNLGTKVKN